MATLKNKTDVTKELDPEIEDAKSSEKATKKPGSKEKGKKRTKSGCLTCRRRRIKCGEERPTCSNCTKSKRQCEGYNQRVVFKDPLNAYRGSQISGSSQISFSEPRVNARRDNLSQALPSGPLPIAPKPGPGPLGLSIVTSEKAVPTLPSSQTPGIERRVYSFSNNTEYHSPTKPASSKSAPQNQLVLDTIDQSHIPEPKRKPTPNEQHAHYDFDAYQVKKEGRDEVPITPAQSSPQVWSAGPSTSATFFPSYPTSSWLTTPISATSRPSISPHNQGSKAYVEFEDFSRANEKGDQIKGEHHLSGQQSFQMHQPRPTDWKMENHSGIELDDEENEDDPFDISDEDVTMEEQEYDNASLKGTQLENYLQKNDLGIVVALKARQDVQDMRIRVSTAFIDRPNMLATYIPSPQSSPLSDNMTARIFCHFINVTAPSMTMFERHPANPSLMFQGRPISKSQQHIWTYTFPTLALHNQGLLHAMLALASLQIAKLQNGPVTASLKHYAIGLRRVAKSVSLPSRRGNPATLAAAMLLAFYECWGADHQKWSNHLLGARQLVKEIDFAGMSKYKKALKITQREEESARNRQAQQAGTGGYYEDRTRFQAISKDVDENIVSMLMGTKLRYDQYGHVIDESLLVDRGTRCYTEREMETYEIQRDLFWWYCKQDVYQSILGGGRLFMEYDFWGHCPPRAPLGRLNATYGTFDHLILLMGRLAEFAAKDIKRKRLAMKAAGGWRPAPTIGGPNNVPPTQIFQMPNFKGMVPDVSAPQLPMGFSEPLGTPPQSRHGSQSSQSNEASPNEDLDLNALQVEAEEEWQEIRNAFSILEDHFGDDFQALGSEFSTPIQTPFGTALQFRTYGIAGIWMNFYMALIVCQRVHPSMPPAAMMASGIAARQTTSFAHELGRIAAGIVPECYNGTTQVSPGVGAALIESSTCLFVAGVQYQDPAQRSWTINRLHDIVRLTGWQTANAIATGCETAWQKTGELGHGPRYQRTTKERVIPNIWNSALRVNRPSEMTSHPSQNAEKRVVISRPDRLHYALGMLGVDEDFEHLDLDNCDG